MNYVICNRNLMFISIYIYIYILFCKGKDFVVEMSNVCFMDVG
jgi:hypothetical protein